MITVIDWIYRERGGLHISVITVLGIFPSGITVFWGKTYDIMIFHLLDGKLPNNWLVFDYKPFKPPFLVTVFDRNFDGVTVSETPTNPSLYIFKEEYFPLSKTWSFKHETFWFYFFIIFLLILLIFSSTDW